MESCTSPRYLVMLLLSACAAPAPEPRPPELPSAVAPVAPPLPPHPATPDPVPPPPVARPTPACVAEPLVRVLPRDDGQHDLVGLLANVTDQPVELSLAAACPAGPARFTGLPPGYDAADLCAVGPCPPGSSDRVTVVLPPLGTVEVGRVTVGAPTGCREALPGGRYAVGLTVETGATLCPGRTATLRVTGPPKAPTPPTREPAPEPTPPTPAPPSRPREDPCPAMACAYEPCPPGVEPPTGCAAVCGCPGGRGRSILER